MADLVIRQIRTNNGEVTFVGPPFPEGVVVAEVVVVEGWRLMVNGTGASTQWIGTGTP